ncbi:(2Fe-2S)-binding protein [Polyangium aurulentum]|uniref:(2Fe-2S)-binding protein n=1 Tax=Polyangium aurulentum TaxID=2567896 RepID=UPI00197F4F70|nr:(2Fe-2S)-binding protein [Polyangium aurulentum]UQA60030.1 (2Fe-2S)-binding protein [Polyangium aurulentum]
MYVCLCVGVSDQEIRECVASGAATASEVMNRTGAGSGCGTCRATIASMVDGGGGPPDGGIKPCSVRSLCVLRSSSANT